MALFSPVRLIADQILVECGECGVLLKYDKQDDHLEWHDAMELEALLAARYHLLSVAADLGG